MQIFHDKIYTTQTNIKCKCFPTHFKLEEYVLMPDQLETST